MDSEPPQIDIIWEAEDEAPPDLELDAFFERLFQLLEIEQAELAVLVTDDSQMQKYNRDWRQKDKTTDVLSFPSGAPVLPDEPRHLGDLIISQPQAKRQADEIGHHLVKEIRFLCLHGTLHLLGYDHETDQGEMFAYQKELKEQLSSYF